MSTVPKYKMPVSRAKTAYGLLSEIKRIILAEPKRYDQTDWLQVKTDPEAYRTYSEDEFPSCGTIGCIAGWAHSLIGMSRNNPTAIASAGRIDFQYLKHALGLTNDQENELYDGGAAHRQNREGLTIQTVPGTKEHARNGVRHITRFQKKYERQLRATKLPPRP